MAEGATRVRRQARDDAVHQQGRVFGVAETAERLPAEFGSAVLTSSRRALRQEVVGERR